MEPRIWLNTEHGVGIEMGKRGRRGATVKGSKRIFVVEAGRKLVRQVVVEDTFLKEKIRGLLEALRQATEPRFDGDPRRQLGESRDEVCSRFAEAMEGLLGQRPAAPRQQELLYEVDTWRLLETLATRTHRETSLRDDVLKWVQGLSKRAVLDVLRRCEGSSEDDRFYTVLGWLVAANLNLDAARLALAEGEVPLAQLLMCRGSPSVTKRMMQGVLPPSRNTQRRPELVSLIYSFIAGESHALLDAFHVDWHIRLGAALMRDTEEVVLSRVLEELLTKSPPVVSTRDLQFQMLMLFARLEEGHVIQPDQIAHLLQLDPSRRDASDVCLKWLIYLVLSSAQVITPQNEPKDMVAQLFHTFCGLCEDLNLPAESAFISLHQSLPLPAVRSRVERSIGMSIQHWIEDPSRELFLSETLQLPSNWILQVKAYWYKQCHQWEKELECLVELELYDEAHQILMLNMIPNSVLPSSPLDLGPIVDLLREKRLTDFVQHITLWDLGGGIILSVHSLLGRQDMSSQELFDFFSEEMSRIDNKICEAKELWSRLAGTREQKMKIERMYEVLSLRMEQQYCALYGAIHGEDYIMTRVLLHKCQNREHRLSMF